MFLLMAGVAGFSVGRLVRAGAGASHDSDGLNDYQRRYGTGYQPPAMASGSRSATAVRLVGGSSTDARRSSRSERNLMDERPVSNTLTSEQARDLRPTEPKRADKSLGELFSEMSEDLSTLFRKEVELAKVEAKEEVAQIGSAAGMYTGAGVAGLLTLTLLSFALAWWIDQKLNTAVSFLIVAMIWAIVGLALASVARKKMKDVEVLPKTKATIKEDLEWAKAQKR